MQSLEDLFKAETMQLLEAVMTTATVAERATVAHSAGMTLAWLDGVRAGAPASPAEQIAIRRALRGVESDRRWEEMAQLLRRPWLGQTLRSSAASVQRATMRRYGGLSFARHATAIAKIESLGGCLSYCGARRCADTPPSGVAGALPPTERTTVQACANAVKQCARNSKRLPTCMLERR